MTNHKIKFKWLIIKYQNSSFYLVFNQIYKLKILVSFFLLTYYLIYLLLKPLGNVNLRLFIFFCFLFRYVQIFLSSSNFSFIFKFFFFLLSVQIQFQWEWDGGSIYGVVLIRTLLKITQRQIVFLSLLFLIPFEQQKTEKSIKHD